MKAILIKNSNHNTSVYHTGCDGEIIVPQRVLWLKEQLCMGNTACDCSDELGALGENEFNYEKQDDGCFIIKNK